MKVAVILAYPIEYDTSALLRCKGIMQGFVDLGHDVVCLCPPADNGLVKDEGDSFIQKISIIRYGRRLIDGKVIVADARNKKNCISRMKGLLHWLYKKIDIFGSSIVNFPYKKCVLNQIIKGDFDCMISFSDPLTAHLIGGYCKKKYKSLYYIQQWGDPLVTDNIAKTNLPVFIRKYIEGHMIKMADKVCYVSPFTLREQKKVFPKEAKKMVFTPSPSLTYNIKDRDVTKSLCIGYFGGYNSVARNLVPFYNAAKRVRDIQFYIIGDSDLHFESAENIEIHRRMCKAELNKYVQSCDVLVCLMNKIGNQIPGKFYHDASLSKDLLVIKDGEFGDAIQAFFEKYDHYTFVDNREDAITAVLYKYLSEGVPIRESVKEFEYTEVAKEVLYED